MYTNNKNPVAGSGTRSAAAHPQQVRIAKAFSAGSGGIAGSCDSRQRATQMTTGGLLALQPLRSPTLIASQPGNTNWKQLLDRCAARTKEYFRDRVQKGFLVTDGEVSSHCARAWAEVIRSQGVADQRHKVHKAALVEEVLLAIGSGNIVEEHPPPSLLPAAQSIVNPRVLDKDEFEERKVLLWGPVSEVKAYVTLASAAFARLDPSLWISARCKGTPPSKRFEFVCPSVAHRERLFTLLLQEQKNLLGVNRIVRGRSFAQRLSERGGWTLVRHGNRRPIIDTGGTPAGRLADNGNGHNRFSRLAIQTSDSELRVGLLNCCGLLRRLPEIRRALGCRSYGAFAVCETHEPGENPSRVFIPGYTYYRKPNTSKKGGVGLFIRDDLAGTVKVLPCDVQNLLAIQLRVVRQVVTLVSIYTPPAMCNDEFSDVCHTVRSLKDSAPGPFFFLGDLNARVGNVSEAIGCFNENIINPKGRIFLGMLEDSHLWLYNGRTKPISGTVDYTRWQANPQGVVGGTVIDYIGGSTNPSDSDMTGVEILDDLGSDHFPLACTLPFTMPNAPSGGKTRRKFRLERLPGRTKRPDEPQVGTEPVVSSQSAVDVPLGRSEATLITLEKFAVLDRYTGALAESLKEWRAKIVGFMEGSTPVDRRQQEIDVLFDEWLQVVLRTAESTVGSREVSRKARHWWDSEMTNAVRRRKVAFRKVARSRNPTDWEAYLEMRRECSNLSRKKSQKSWVAFNEKVNDLRCSDPKQFWTLAKGLYSSRKSAGVASLAVETADGSEEFTSDASEMSEIFREYLVSVGNRVAADSEFDEVHATKVCSDLSRWEDERTEESMALPDGVEEEAIARGLHSAKLGKAMGLDGLPIELLIGEDCCDITLVHLLFELCVSWRVTPSIWRTALICPVFKKGDKTLKGNYRPISLVPHVAKLFGKCFLDRTKSLIEPVEEQGGFRDGRGTEDQLFTLIRTMEFYEEKGKPVYSAFIDLEKAYDSVWRPGLWAKLIERGVPEGEVALLQNMYQDVRGSVVVNGARSSEGSFKLGVKQGDVMSPALFNLYIDDMIKEVLTKGTGLEIPLSGGAYELICLLYADDIVLTAGSPEDLQKSLNLIHEWCRTWRLRPSASKTKVMVSSVGRALPSHRGLQFRMGESLLEEVDEFCYLGLIITHDLDWISHMEWTITKANKRWAGMRAVWSNNRLTVQTKLTVWNATIRPMFEYGAEFWGHDVKVRSKVDLCMRSHWRNILCCMKSTPLAAIYGDLCVPSFGSRTDLATFKLLMRYWKLPNDRLVARFLRELPMSSGSDSRRQVGWYSIFSQYCEQVANLPWLESVGSGERADQWNACWNDCWINGCAALGMEAEEGWWQKELQEKSSLKRYANLLKDADGPTDKPVRPVRIPPYLCEGTSRTSQILFKARCNWLPIRHLLSKWDNGSGHCLLCELGTEEDVQHFVYDCKALETVRAECVRSMVQCDESLPPGVINASNWWDYALGCRIPGASKESAANLIRTGKLVVSRLYSARGKLIESVSSPSEEASVTTGSSQPSITDFFSRVESVRMDTGSMVCRTRTVINASPFGV